MNKRIAAAAALAVATAAVVAGCGSVNHDSANPSRDVQYQWVRIETPPSFQTIMFGCFGNTGMYLDQGDGNLSQIANDPLCPIANVFNPAIQEKYGFKLVTRTNSNNAGTS
jgi:hypothetical protein